jgi:hypothetical protein
LLTNSVTKVGYLLRVVFIGVDGIIAMNEDNSCQAISLGFSLCFARLSSNLFVFSAYFY